MAIEVEILYSDLTKKRVDVLDKAALNDDAQIPKVGALAVLLSTLKNGVDTRVEFVEEMDNYILTVNPIDRIVSLYGWLDNEGGWYRIDSPFASDGYSRPTMPPFLLPYKTDFDYWIFRGEQVDNSIWAASKDTRNSMR